MRLGSHIIASTSFGNVAAPVAARHLETPSKIKFTCDLGEARYFTITRDKSFWGTEAYGIAAMNEEAFNKAKQDADCPDIYTTISAARMRAEGLNLSAAAHQADTAISIQPATNQSIKFQ